MPTRARLSATLPRVAAGLIAVLVAGVGCTAEPVDDGRPLIVSTTTIVGDLVSQVADDEARVEVLMPVGADPHDFEPSAQQAASLRDAALVVSSGLGLEAGLADALEAAAEEGTPILELGTGLDPQPLGDDANVPDPHWWLDPVRGAQATRLIGDRLATIVDGDWVARAATYADELEALDDEMRAALDAVPSSRRTLITSHDAFDYFADRYGFEVVGVLIPGGTTQAAPDPRALADLAAIIRETAVPAIFAETTLPTNVAEALAAEVGGEVEVVVLLTGSLGEPGSGADSYVGMLRTNADRIAEALD
jgi:zinc/manganese transport system substrate-binding protein